jgi:hypothetical protein
MKLTWEYYTESAEKVTVILEPEEINLSLISTIARLLGAINADQHITVGKNVTDEEWSNLSK